MPGPLQAGVATFDLEQPVGVALGGYLRATPSTDPGSPWAKQLPASRGVQSTPTVRALALSNGKTRVALVRLDATLTSPSLRTRVLAGLQASLPDVKVLLYATHSHAAPARILPPALLGGAGGTDFVSLVMDHYDAEVERRTAQHTVEAIEAAFASLVNVSLGVATIDAADFNNDRRCENDPLYGPGFRDTAVTVIRIDSVDGEGRPVAPLTALLHYAMHGTVLGSENTWQSTEAPGALELYASDAVGVPVLYVQGAAGDVSPAGSPFHHGEFQRLERQGRAQAQLVAQAFAQAAPGPAAASGRLEFHERGVTVSRAAIGYAQGEFPEGGALQCGAGGAGACGEVVAAPEDVVCLPLQRRPAFKTPVSLLRLGDDVHFLSMPGEPGTGLSRKLQQALAPLGAAHPLTIGYAQDHYGYLLEENDWLRGGYEPTVSAWGWKFGPYLLSEVQTFVQTLDAPQPEADLVTAFPTEDAGARVPAAPAQAPGIVTEPMDAARLSTHRLVFDGLDPALGLPKVALELQQQGQFSPVLASPTRPVVNGPELPLRYDALPTFKAEPLATTREHRWTALFETLPSTPLGTYRFVVTLADGTTLTSRGFEVTASEALQVDGAVTAGVLTLAPRFPPNPTLFDGSGDVVGNYRVRDPDSDPAVGARAQGQGSLAARLTLLDGGSAAVSLSWSAVDSAWTGEARDVARVTVDAVEDVYGNSAGGPVEVVP